MGAGSLPQGVTVCPPTSNATTSPSPDAYGVDECFARETDGRDPLASYRDRFLIPNRPDGEPAIYLFNDTFTNHYHPSVGRAAVEVLEAARLRVGLAPNVCCGRPLISQGMLAKAREQARANTELLFPLAKAGRKILFCEPSCLSAVREDAPDLLRGAEQEKARVVGEACLLVEQYLHDVQLQFRSGLFPVRC